MLGCYIDGLCELKAAKYTLYPMISDGCHEAARRSKALRLSSIAVILPLAT